MAPDLSVGAAADGGALPEPATRVLILAPFPPCLDGTHGGSRAIAHLVAALSVKNRVALAYLRARDEPPASAELCAMCELVHEGARPGYSDSAVRPWTRVFALLPKLATGRPLWIAARWNREFAARVRELIADWRPHVVQAEFSAMAQYVERGRNDRARTVVTIHEPGVQASAERIARRERASLFWRLDGRLWEHFERKVIRRMDATVAFTDRDRVLLEQLDTAVRVVRIPLGDEPPSLLFFGNFSHPPNLDAVEWLLTEIFPPLRHRFEGLQLSIVGAAMPSFLLETSMDGVTITGEVPSLGPFLERTAVVVAPLRHGGGMRVKVLEALAAGKAVVATPTAVEGLGLEHGRQALVAEDTPAFIDSVALLLDQPERRAQLAQAGRAWAESGFAWSRTAAAYQALYDRLTRGARDAEGMIS